MITTETFVDQIEAAARALYAMCSEDGLPWQDLHPARRQAYRIMARRVLAAAKDNK